MIKKLLTISLFVTLFSGCVVQTEEIKSLREMPAGEYQLDKAHASLIFKVNHLGLSKYTARFTDFDSNINFDPENFENSAVTTVVKSNSIKTDFPFVKRKDFDKFLSQNEYWLNSKNFPEIKFESTKIKKTGSTKGIIYGNLTMLGETKPIKLKVRFNGSYKNKPHVGLPALGFSAKGKIKRSEWGFGAYIPAIGDEIKIIIETEYHKNN